ncbi:MAG: AMP-binding protein [Treponema sp.]|jgi:long-chain acyl-CoA synthetase|nr:AMP-binding protein [Treponema sp.]
MKKPNKLNTLAPATLADLCISAAAKFKDHLAFSMISEGEITASFTYEQMGYRSRQVGSLLRQLDIKKGDRVLLFSESCPEWGITYFGIALAGAVSVPLLTGFSTEQIKNIAVHSGISAICLNRNMMEKFEEISAMQEFSKIPLVFMDSMTDTEVSVSIGGTEKTLQMPACTGQIENYQNNGDDLATIIYTSGTQGNSKGVMLSSKNILSSAASAMIFVEIYPQDRLLSVLPLAHSYECSLGLLAPLLNGASVTYLDKPPSASILLPALKLVRPTILICVPMLIEKIYNNGIGPKLKANSLYKFPLTRPLAIKVAGKKLLAAMGGELKFLGVGGAPLSPSVAEFLYKAKFPYTIGYGLTEAAPLISGNAPLCFKLGAGDIPAHGVSYRIGKCEMSEPGIGEIEVQGPNVMLGYYNDNEKTAEVITSDGWLRTGDLGSVDNKGKLHIRGRLKALILGPSGENIYPEEIEGLLGSSALVEDALVYSGKKGELVALVRLTDTAKAAADAAAGAIEHTLENLRTWVNKKLADFSRLARIELRTEPFEKTPTMKIKRYLYV